MPDPCFHLSSFNAVVLDKKIFMELLESAFEEGFWYDRPADNGSHVYWEEAFDRWLLSKGIEE